VHTTPIIPSEQEGKFFHLVDWESLSVLVSKTLFNDPDSGVCVCVCACALVRECVCVCVCVCVYLMRVFWFVF
jgi:hypothetical protein